MTGPTGDNGIGQFSITNQDSLLIINNSIEKEINDGTVESAIINEEYPSGYIYFKTNLTLNDQRVFIDSSENIGIIFDNSGSVFSLIGGSQIHDLGVYNSNDNYSISVAGGTMKWNINGVTIASGSYMGSPIIKPIFKLSKIGDSIYDISYGYTQAGPQGTSGNVGSTGPTGIQGNIGGTGSIIYSNTGTPNISLGRNGDYYIDTLTGQFYGPKRDNELNYIENLGITNAVIGTDGSGEYLIVGDTTYNSNDGGVYVYKNINETYTLIQTLTADGPIPVDEKYGRHLAINRNGDTLAVYSRDVSFNNVNYYGVIYVYDLIDSSWNFNTKLYGDLSGNRSELIPYGYGIGFSISGDGTRLIVSNDSFNGSNGIIYIYTKSGGTWSLTNTIISPDSGSNQFGFDTKINYNGNLFAVSAPYYDDNFGNESVGKVYVYEYDQMNSLWNLVIDFIGDASGNSLGNGSLTMDTSGLIIGARVVGYNNQSGAIQIFRNTGTWTSDVLFSPSDSSENDYPGEFSAMSADGNIYLYGLSSVKYAFYLFKYIDGTWTELQKIEHPGSPPSYYPNQIIMTNTLNKVFVMDDTPTSPNLFLYENLGWGSGFSIKGTSGLTGPTGPTGPTLPINGIGTGYMLIGDSINPTGTVYYNTNVRIDNTGTSTGPTGTSMYYSTHIIPSTGDYFCLGTPDNRWKDIYLTSSTIYLGPTATISADEIGNLQINGQSYSNTGPTGYGPTGSYGPALFGFTGDIGTNYIISPTANTIKKLTTGFNALYTDEGYTNAYISFKTSILPENLNNQRVGLYGNKSWMVYFNSSDKKVYAEMDGTPLSIIANTHNVNNVYTIYASNLGIRWFVNGVQQHSINFLSGTIKGYFNLTNINDTVSNISFGPLIEGPTGPTGSSGGGGGSSYSYIRIINSSSPGNSMLNTPTDLGYSNTYSVTQGYPDTSLMIVNPSNITVATNGIYRIFFKAWFISASDNGSRYVRININGDTQENETSQTYIAGASDMSPVNTSYIYQLTAGDTLQFYVYHSFGSFPGTIQINNYVIFIEKLA